MKYLYALNVLKTQCVCTVVHQKLHRHWNYGKIQTDACASSKSMDRLTIIRCISRNYLLFQDRISRGEKKPTTQSFPGDRHKRRIRSIQSSRNTKFNLNSYSSFSKRAFFVRLKLEFVRGSSASFSWSKFWKMEKIQKDWSFNVIRLQILPS